MVYFGAEAETRTLMSIRSLRPEGGDGFYEPRARVAFREVRSKGGFAGMV